MKDRRLRLIHLHRSIVVTRPLIRRILDSDPLLENIYNLNPGEWVKYFSLPTPRATQLYKDLHDKNLLKLISEDLKVCKVITLFDPSYPPLLKTIKDPPYVLYLLGDQKLLLQLPSLSVVGTRNPTPEAKRKIEKIIAPLVEHDWVIVSGMAKGIDGLAHRLALEKKGKTIAVLGSGFKHIYPGEHRQMFYELAKQQLVISEYAPNQPARKHHFPERNRIISGLGFGTIVIEAKERSGSLITVEQALDQGREVYAVPGSPLVSQTTGCHKMIQDGAKLVQSTHDILEDWDDQKQKWCQVMSDYTEKNAIEHTKYGFHV